MHFLGTHKHLVDQSGPMGLRSVPYNKKWSLDMSADCTQEGNHPRGRDVLSCMKGKVKSYPLAVGRNRQRRNDRHFAMPPAHLVQDRCFAARRPSTLDQRGQHEAAFVYEDDGGIQCAGFFLMRGQVAFIQWRIAFSSRSRASRSGFCGDQPIARKSRGRYLWL